MVWGEKAVVEKEMRNYIQIGDKKFKKLSYLDRFGEEHVKSIEYKPGDFAPDKHAVVFIATHGVLPYLTQAGFDNSIFSNDDLDENTAFQKFELDELQYVEKITITTPGIPLYTFDPREGEEEAEKSRSLLCGDHGECLGDILDHTHDTFASHIIETYHTNPDITAEELAKMLGELYNQVKQTSDEDIDTNYNELKNMLINIASDQGIRINSQFLESTGFRHQVFSSGTEDFAQVMINAYGLNPKDEDNNDDYDELNALQQALALLYEAQNETSRFFKTYTIRNGQEYINKIYGFSKEETELPGLVYKIHILNMIDINGLQRIALPPVKISWSMKPFCEVGSLENYISSQQLYTYLAYLGYTSATIIDATCSCFDEAAGTTLNRRQKASLRKLIRDIPYGGKNNNKKSIRKSKKKNKKLKKTKKTKKNTNKMLYRS
jgi:hypothetical protein